MSYTDCRKWHIKVLRRGAAAGVGCGLVMAAEIALLLDATAVVTPAMAEVETVVVTAQRRAQDILAVPITVQAIGGDQLKETNTSNLGDLQTVAPSLFMDTTNGGAADTTFRIRGVGTTGNNTGLEGAVGVFIDDVYRNRGGLALGDLVDVQRVEVLEGPQSTLFGKNTSAGAINVITNLPTDQYGGEAEATVENYDGYKLDGWANIPLTDILFTRWAIVYDNRDGFIKDVNSNQTINDRNRGYIRGQALWEPNADVSLRMIVDYGQSAEHCCGAIDVFNGVPAPLINFLAKENGYAPNVASRQNYVESAIKGPLYPVDSQDQGISADLNWRLSSEIQLTDIVAYRDFMQTQTITDAGFSGADLVDVPLRDLKDRVFSEELRLSGSHSFDSIVDSIQWLAGGYYSNENIGQNQITQDGTQIGNYLCEAFQQSFGFAGNCLVGASAAANTLPVAKTPFGIMNFNLLKPGTGDFEHFFEFDNSWSLFESTTVNFTPKLALTGGLRYLEDRKAGGGSFVNDNPTQAPGITPCAAFAAIPGGCFYNFPFQFGTVLPYRKNVDNDALTGNASLQYMWDDGLMTYIAFGRGFKAGGVNLDRTAAGIVSGNLGSVYYPTSFFNPTFRPETSENYEAGIKSRFWDNRVALSGTAFYTQFHNLQVLNFDGLDFHITNAASAYTKGFEEQGEAELFDGFVVSSALTFAETAYGQGIILPLLVPLGEAPITPGACAANLVPFRAGCLGGRPLTNAPRWSATNGFTYDFPIAETGLTGALHADMFNASSRNTGSDLDTHKQVGGYTLFNGHLAVTSADSGWQVAAWCRNCTNRHYETVIFDPIDQQGSPGKYPGSYDAFIGDPLTYGLTITKNF